MDLTPFSDLIKERSGLCFDDVRTVTLQESIRRRMSETGMGSAAGYFNYIFDDRDEFLQLVNLLTVNETYFFREPFQLDLLVTQVVPALLAAKKGDDKIKIVSAGCSTGEEPYSIVMKLMEKYGAGVNKLVSVIGFDIDSDALGRAREGVYHGHSFRGFPDPLRQKYFEKTGEERYEISDIVKHSVEFAELNLSSGSYPDEIRGADVVFYRNVSIYFEAETQKRIFRKLADILCEKGYLFVSATETLSHDIGILSLQEIDGIFLYRKNIGVGIGDRRKTSLHERTRVLSSQPAPERIRIPRCPDLSSPGPAAGAGVEKRKDGHELFEEALSLARAKQYDEALRCLDDLIARDQGFMRAYTLKGGVLINMKRLDEAELICLRSIEMDQWCLEGYLLLGLIARTRMDDEAAVKRFKEALYIQSSCWLAHFYLAEIHRSRDEFTAARREYEIVIKLLRKGDLQDQGLVFFPLAFPADQIAHLCNYNLTRLKKSKAGTGGE